MSKTTVPVMPKGKLNTSVFEQNNNNVDEFPKKNNEFQGLRGKKLNTAAFEDSNAQDDKPVSKAPVKPAISKTTANPFGN